MNDQIRTLHIEQELALLRADLATSSPESYSIDEMKQITSDIELKTEALDEAIRKDFNSLSPEGQAKMLDMLKSMGGVEDGFWERLLL